MRLEKLAEGLAGAVDLGAVDWAAASPADWEAAAGSSTSLRGSRSISRTLEADGDVFSTSRDDGEIQRSSFAFGSDRCRAAMPASVTAVSKR